MTISEMHLAFRLQLDKSTSLVGNPDFLPEEIDYWLNEAQDRFIKQRMSGNNYRQEKFDDVQKRIDDLQSLIIYSTAIGLSQSSLAINAKECLLPITDASYPYMFYINSSVYNSGSTQLQTGGIIKYSNVNDYLKDYINNPYIRRPLVTFRGNYIVFIHGDEFIPVQCDITYIRRPRKLTSFTVGTYETATCELPLHTHPEIVVLAVSLVIENTESPRVQTFEPINVSKVE
jgi:hypothetical protein